MESGGSNDGRTPTLRAARVLSGITFPPVVALPVFLVLDTKLAGLGSRLLIVLVTIAFGVAWPFAVSSLMHTQHRRSNLEGPRERLVLLGSGALGYAVGVGALVAVDAPVLVTLLMFCYATNTAVMFGINVYWRASIHAMGIAGPTVALVFGFGLPGALLSLLLPPVGWSRIRLGAHTLPQVVVGAGLGYLLTGAQILLGLRFF